MRNKAAVYIRKNNNRIVAYESVIKDYILSFVDLQILMNAPSPLMNVPIFVRIPTQGIAVDAI